MHSYVLCNWILMMNLQLNKNSDLCYDQHNREIIHVKRFQMSLRFILDVILNWITAAVLLIMNFCDYQRISFTETACWPLYSQSFESLQLSEMILRIVSRNKSAFTRFWAIKISFFNSFNSIFKESTTFWQILLSVIADNELWTQALS